MFQVGDRIEDYQIVARLKAGGMATLFLGRRKGAAGFARHVAIKVVHPHLSSDSTFVDMFLDEARLSAQIHHPNVVHVEELGEVDGSYYMVMEYVRGCSLSQFLRSLAKRERRMSPELATYIAIKMAEGLHAAHEATDDEGQLLQVVHRDVSPQNILVAYKGHLKLIDFGIAKAQGRAQQTTARSLKGKLRYMAPEQAWGHEVDRRTDIYALGIVLWEMLTMRRLFSGDDDFALLEEVRKPYIVAPSSVSDGIPEALDAAVLRALKPDMKDRQATAKELRTDLIRAMPSAVALDTSNLSDLLRVVMASDIEREQAALPESVSKVLETNDPTRTVPPDQESIGTLTVHSIGSDLSSDEEELDIDLASVMQTGPSSRRGGRVLLAATLSLVVIGGAIAIGRYSVSEAADADEPQTIEPAVSPAEAPAAVPAVEPDPEPPAQVAVPMDDSREEAAPDAAVGAVADRSADRARERERARRERERARARDAMMMESSEMEETPMMATGSEIRTVGMTNLIVGMGDAPF